MYPSAQKRVHRKTTVKLTLRDLPLHAVSNEDVLDTLCPICEVQSEVQYANVWYDGRLTNIRNGDRFVYIDTTDVSKFGDTITVGEHRARIIKPKMLSTCKRCGKEGHHATDLTCPARVPEEMKGTVEVFRGGEHCYQFRKLKAHDKKEEAFELLDEPEPFKVMRRAQEILPEDQVSEEWKATTIDEMRVANTMKFRACAHARDALMKANPMIAEAMNDRFWGTGLGPEWTKQCLPEFWPGQNHMGEVLMDLRKSLSAEADGVEDGNKQKASSPLVQESAKRPEHES